MGNKPSSDRTREMTSTDNGKASSSRQTTEFLRTLQSAEVSTTKASDIPRNLRMKREELNTLRKQAIGLLESGNLNDQKRELMNSRFKVFEETFRNMEHFSSLEGENENLWPIEYKKLKEDKDIIMKELVDKGILDKK